LSIASAGRLKLKLHTAEAGGIVSIIESGIRSKLNLHATEVGGIQSLHTATALANQGLNKVKLTKESIDVN
jgi:hypothetical protein